MKKNKIFGINNKCFVTRRAVMVIIHLVAGGHQKNEQTNSQSEKLKRIMTKIRMRIKSITLKMALKVFMSQAIRQKAIRLMN